MAICSADGCSRREPCGPYCRDNGNFDIEITPTLQLCKLVDKLNAVEAREARFRKALQEVHKEGMSNHNTRCRNWWPTVCRAIGDCT